MKLHKTTKVRYILPSEGFAPRYACKQLIRCHATPGLQEHARPLSDTPEDLVPCRRKCTICSDAVAVSGLMVRAGVRKTSTRRLVPVLLVRKSVHEDRMCTPIDHMRILSQPSSTVFNPPFPSTRQGPISIINPSNEEHPWSSLNHTVSQKFCMMRRTRTLNQHNPLLIAVRLAFTSTKDKCADTLVGMRPIGSDSIVLIYVQWMVFILMQVW